MILTRAEVDVSNVHWWIIGYCAVLLVYLGVQIYLSGRR